MKNKSELYKMAQIAVLKNQSIDEEDKLDIIRMLQANEDVALFTEREVQNGESV